MKSNFVIYRTVSLLHRRIAIFTLLIKLYFKESQKCIAGKDLDITSTNRFNDKENEPPKFKDIQLASEHYTGCSGSQNLVLLTDHFPD